MFSFGYSQQIPTASTDTAVYCSKLTHRYNSADRDALSEVTFQVSAGEVVALLGHNGAGKTTLLKILAGSLVPSSGKVYVWGTAPRQQPHRVAYLAQRSALRWDFPISLRELVATGTFVRRGWFRGLSREDRNLVERTIRALGLASFAHRPISALSGGQQQRALLARALVHDADLFLLDEPFTAVDEETCQILLAQFAQLKNQNRTLIITTHNCDAFEELRPRKIVLRDGKVEVDTFSPQGSYRKADHVAG